MESAPIFKQAGINLLLPILGLNAAWPEPGKHEWSEFDRLFARLLARDTAEQRRHGGLVLRARVRHAGKT